MAPNLRSVQDDSQKARQPGFCRVNFRRQPLIAFLVLTLCVTSAALSQQAQRTYCNPVNLDYGYCPIPDFVKWGKHRTTADPAIVLYRNDFYLFSTNQKGYWWSHDMLRWHFLSRSFLPPGQDSSQGKPVYDDITAPAAWVMGDTLLVFGSTYTDDYPIWMSTDPKHNLWKEAVDSFKIGGWDPDFYLASNGKLYMYNGSSDVYPIYGVQIDRHTLQPIGERKPMIQLDYQRYGWQRFGEYNDNIFLPPFIEGSWMTEHDGKYYLQYATPGTEFKTYADGIAISDNPLGPFHEQSFNPFSYKPGGFARGAGHGSTFQDQYGNWWHVSTIAINVKNNFERRIGIWPSYFDKEGTLYSNTAFGDYPQYLPGARKVHPDDTFTGWMLLNYARPVMVSSTLGGHHANYAVDENIRTYWSAATGNPGEWIESDLGNVDTVYAVQINYADQDAPFMGKQLNIYEQYRVDYSLDGKTWKTLIDKSHNKTDVPHDYVQLGSPVRARYLKLTNLHMPGGKFAISGFRVFGKGTGPLPDSVQYFTVLRTHADKRSAWIRWKPVDNAYAYNIYFGVELDKLYDCIMVYGDNEYFFEGMDKDKPYYFQIEAINESGVSPRSAVVKAD
jgi:xylan 1,4-beta-xylosidase